MTRRYPFASLAAAMGETEAAAARQLGLSGSTEQDYRRRGVTERVADRLAVKAGLHPFEVWTELADNAAEETTRRCENCTDRYWPRQRNQRFCSQRCSTLWHKREHSRRRYHGDSLYAERKRAQVRAYYAECAELAQRREQRRVA